MNEYSVLISGGGIAGPALAHWLHRYGIRSTIVEQAPEPAPEPAAEQLVEPVRPLFDPPVQH